MGDTFAGGFEAAAVAEPIVALLAFTVVAVLFVMVKWGFPQRAKLKEKQLDIERYRIEVQEKADAALDERERERIKATQAGTEQQRQNNENTKALVTVVTALEARLNESASRSHEMGGTVTHIDGTANRIDSTTMSMAKQLDEVHAIVVRRKGADDER